MLYQSSDGFVFTGQVILLDDRPYWIQYEINCDYSWITVSAWVMLTSGNYKVRKHIELRPDGSWWAEGKEIPELQGCLDVDLGFSPVTNTLPIRRLQLKDGESREIVASWIRFPDLEIKQLRQAYTNLGGGRYLYRSVLSGFTAEITVDDLGLVKSYASGWLREAVI